MAERKKASAKRKPGPKPADESDQKVCFVVSPIGKKETERHTQFKNVLEYTIKPAVKDSGYKIQVLRADDIDRAGSFIKALFMLAVGGIDQEAPTAVRNQACGVGTLAFLSSQ